MAALRSRLRRVATVDGVDVWEVAARAFSEALIFFIWSGE